MTTEPIWKPDGSRMHTPSIHNQAAYAADTSFFAKHKRRRIYIRHRMPEEFYTDMSIPYLLRTPQVYVLVHRFNHGIHKVDPIWIGNQFWGDLATDGEVCNVLIECHRKWGFDRQALEQSLSELTKFDSEQRSRLVN